MEAACSSPESSSPAPGRPSRWRTRRRDDAGDARDRVGRAARRGARRGPRGAAGLGATPAAERGELLHAVAAWLREHTEEIADRDDARGRQAAAREPRRGRLDGGVLRLLRGARPCARRPRDPAGRGEPARARAQGADRRRRAASCPGTTRCCCSRGSWRRRSPPATPACASPAELTPMSTLMLAPAFADFRPASVDSSRAPATSAHARRRRARRLRRVHRQRRDRQGDRRACIDRVARLQPRVGGKDPFIVSPTSPARSGRGARAAPGRLPERGAGLHVGRALLRARRRLRQYVEALRRTRARLASATPWTRPPTSGRWPPPRSATRSPRTVEAAVAAGRGGRRRRRRRDARQGPLLLPAVVTGAPPGTRCCARRRSGRWRRS